MASLTIDLTRFDAPARCRPATVSARVVPDERAPPSPSHPPRTVAAPGPIADEARVGILVGSVVAGLPPGREADG
jgi:hypothetical protein